MTTPEHATKLIRIIFKDVGEAILVTTQSLDKVIAALASWDREDQEDTITMRVVDENQLNFLKEVWDKQMAMRSNT